MAHVLLVDGDPSRAGAVSALLERGGAHTVARARGGREGLAAFAARRPDVVLLDLALDDPPSADVLRALVDEDAVVIVIADAADAARPVEALQLGAESVVERQALLPRLAMAVERAAEKSRLRRTSRHLARQRGGGRDAPATIVGPSAAMRELAQQIAMLAQGDRVAVLLVGECGTGKGRIAEYIHANGPRAARPFVEADCVTPPPVLERALFGGEGAPGLLELADGGSIFLEEIGDLDPALQPRVLRVLDGATFHRVGATEPIATRVRVIASTHRDLVNEVTEGRFREDLYYRLSVMPVHLPPLRARSRDDLAALVEALLGELAREIPDAPRRLTDDAMARLLAYGWPGNIRELRNVLERAMLLARGAEHVGASLLPVEVRHSVDTPARGERHVPRSLDDVERAHIERTLRAHGDNRTHAARELGISRATLIKKIRDYAL